LFSAIIAAVLHRNASRGALRRKLAGTLVDLLKLYRRQNDDGGASREEKRRRLAVINRGELEWISPISSVCAPNPPNASTIVTGQTP
jgi:hypothetical protein